MATSGSFEVLQGDGKVLMTFYWERTAYSVSDSISSILWTATGQVQTANGTMNIRSDSIDSLRVNGEEIFTNSGGNFSKGGIFTVTHAGEGQTASFDVSYRTKVVVKATGNIPGSTTVSGWITKTCTTQALPQPAYLTSAAAFNDEGTPSFSYTSPTSSEIEKVEACIGKEDGTPLTTWTNVPKTSTTSQTLTLSSSDRVALRRQITTGNSGQFKVLLRTTIDGISAYRSSFSVRMTLVNYTPILSSPNVTDINTTTIALTGDSNKLIRYCSDVQTVSNAEGRKEARIIDYTVTNGGNSITVEGTGYGTIEDISSDTFTFKATDNRGYSAEETITKTIVPYVRLTAALRIAAFTLSGDMIFTIDGNYFNGSFGKESNSLAIIYTLKKNGQPVGSTTIDPYTTGSLSYGLDTYHYEHTITGLTPVESDGINNSYSLQISIQDKLSGWITSEEITSSAAPIFHWGKNDFTFNVPVHFGRGFTNDVDLKTASFVRTLTMSAAGAYEFGTLDEMGLGYNNEIYCLMGAISSEATGRVYPVPSPPLGNNTGTYIATDATKFWVEGDKIYITVAAAWGTVPVRLVIMYF